MAGNDYYYCYNIFDAVDRLYQTAVLEDLFWNTLTESLRIAARYLFSRFLSALLNTLKKVTALDHKLTVLLWNLSEMALTRSLIDGSRNWSQCYSMGAFHYAKDSRTFGWNSSGKVRFCFFWPEYSGSPLKVVHLFRSEYSDRNLLFHFWQSGSLP